MTDHQPNHRYMEKWNELGAEIREKSKAIGLERSQVYGERFLEDVENQKLTLEIIEHMKEKFHYAPRLSIAISLLQIAVHMGDDTDATNCLIEEIFHDERQHRNLAD